jgi:hypothetical protein
MSAITVLRQTDAVHIATDRAAFSPDDVLQNVMCKQHQLSGLAAVLSLVGFQNVACDLIAVIESAKFETVDELQNKIEGVISPVCAAKCKEWKAQYTVRPGDRGGADFALMVAGWSETRGPITLSLSHAVADDGKSTLSFGSHTFYVTVPGSQQLAQRYDGFLKSLARVSNSSAVVEAALFGLLCDQRREFGVVAGGIGISTITKDGVHSRRVADWPDVIGKPIDVAAPLEIAR